MGPGDLGCLLLGSRSNRNGGMLMPGVVARGEITTLLESWQNPEALNKLIHLVYQDLRAMAQNYLRGGVGKSYRPTMLVHEVYQRLSGNPEQAFENRHHFFNCAGLIMRQLLLERARRGNSLKRGGGVPHDTWEDELNRNGQSLEPELLLALDTALQRLKQLDARKHQVVELRYFLGFSEEEIAAILQVSVRTVRRDWLFCRTWLASELSL